MVELEEVTEKVVTAHEHEHDHDHDHSVHRVLSKARFTLVILPPVLLHGSHLSSKSLTQRAENPTIQNGALSMERINTLPVLQEFSCLAMT